jgi:hypothetical protein
MMATFGLESYLCFFFATTMTMTMITAMTAMALNSRGAGNCEVDTSPTFEPVLAVGEADGEEDGLGV